MMRSIACFAFALGAALAAGCTGSGDEGAADGLETDEDALSLAGRSTFFAVRADTRRCAFPTCGGYFVARVNQPTTRCADGSDQAECYVAELDFGGASVAVLDAEIARVDPTRALLRGSVKPRSYGADVYGAFVSTEVWRTNRVPGPVALGANGEPVRPTFFRVAYGGACGQGCPTLAAAPLNSSLASAPVSWIALDRAYDDIDERGAAVDAAFRARLVTEAALLPPAGTSRGGVLDTSRAFLRVESGTGVASACRSESSCREGLVCCAGQCAARCE